MAPKVEIKGNFGWNGVPDFFFFFFFF